jgi:hypothetical protein
VATGGDNSGGGGGRRRGIEGGHPVVATGSVRDG